MPKTSKLVPLETVLLLLMILTEIFTLHFDFDFDFDAVAAQTHLCYVCSEEET